LGKGFENRNHFWAKNTEFEAPMGFHAPLGAFFINILLSQDRKSVKTDKTGGLQTQFSKNSDNIRRHT